MFYVCMYLVAVIAANLSVAYFGPGSTIVNAFLFIGLDLTSRDKLHDTWHGKGLWWKMALLIGTGSIFSWLLNRNAGQIALASFVAFMVASIIDTVAYTFLRNRAWMIRANGSNVFSAAADSIIFPTIAFGGFLPWIVLGQFAAKVFGGFIWSWIIQFYSKLSRKPVNTQMIEQ